MTTTDNQETQNDTIRQQVRSRYGAIASQPGSDCGCAPSCCSPQGAVANSPTDAVTLGYSRDDLAAVPAGSELGLGCGNPTAIASIRPGETVVDLGSGAGFDCFLAARQTGSSGRVIGVDMTPEMLSKARANAVKGGYANVEFRLGEIEALPLADNSAEVILSNCVINLSPDKPRVFREALRVLKPGGRLAISDIVALQPIPEALQKDFAAYTGCVAGAVSPSELEAMMAAAGFESVRIEPKAGSREFIDQWIPVIRAGDYVSSATITARKPL